MSPVWLFSVWLRRRKRMALNRKWGMVKILVVDDSAFARRRLKSIFESLGYEVAGLAENGTRALELYRSLRPDIVTLDHLMTGKSGEQVLIEMLEIDPDAKVIVISGSGDHAIEDRVLKAGAKEFVPKFNTQNDFGRVIERVINA